MILLDTNVLSELMKPMPDPAVVAWFDAQVTETLFISTLTVAELWLGIGMLPQGRRRDGLTRWMSEVAEEFASRTLSFDSEAALQYASLAVQACASGKGFPIPDGYIAAIAALHGFAVASRDESAFAAARLRIIDPWSAGPG